ncbi:MAG: HlyD family efflux transporter periplasmic adaptor subunit, partial [Novosphingobium sp.]|nr:HlyD family efflux transporter periplasmic adaptor subunit [Novosphingobium sp.]
MSRQRKLVLAVLGGAILIAVLMVVLRPAPEEKPRDARAPLVLTIPLKPGSGPLEVLGSGTVQAREEVTIGAEVAGRLVYVNPQFREGSMIAAGAILFRIDPADYRNRVRTAQADVAAQDVAVLQAGEEVAIAGQELRRFADRRAQRGAVAPTIDENDYASRILPPRALEDETAQQPASPDQAKAPNRLATREPQLRSARAARERAAAQLADARLGLNRTTVRAPFTGLVRSESAARGKLVQPGQELGSIVSAASFEVRVSLTEGEAALIPGLLNARKARMPASVFFDYGGLTYRWSAYVDRADAILDPETRTIDVFLRVPDPLRGGVRVDGDGAGSSPPLLIGSFVRAEMTGASLEAHARIPA